MILRDLRVEGFRCFRSEAHLALSPDRVSVLHGDNGTGKSTLLWALIRAFMDSFKTGGAGAEELRPWGSGLSPSIKVEFEHGGAAYRLSKTFLSGKTARLERLEGARYLPLHEKERVDEELRRMLRCEPKASGLTASANWGIAQVLWSPQDGLAMEKLSGPVREAIRASLGGYIASSGGAKLAKAIKAEFGKAWAPTGKKIKAGSTVEMLAEQMATAEATHLHWAGQAESLRQRQGTLLVQQGEIQTLAARRADLDVSSKRLSLEYETYQARNTERLTTQQAMSLAQARWKALEVKINTLTRLRKREAELAGKLLEFDGQRSAVAERLRSAQVRFENAKGALSQLQKDELHIDSLTRELEAARKHAVLVHALPLAAQLERVQAALAFRGTSADLPALRKLHGELTTTQARLEAARIFLEIVPDSAQQISVKSGEPAGANTIEPGTAFRVTGSPLVELEIAGFGVVRAGGPAESAVALETRLRALEEEWQRRAGGPLAAVEECARLRGELVHLLSAERTRAALDSDKAVLEAQCPRWVDLSPEPETMAAELDRLRGRSKMAQQSGSAELLAAQKDLGLAQAADQSLALNHKNAESELSTVRTDLANTAGDGLTEEQRARARDDAALDYQGLSLQLKRTDEELARFGDDPGKARDLAVNELEAVRKKLQELEVTVGATRGALEALLAESPYDKLAAAEENLAETRRRYDAEKLEADAAKLLWETLQSCEAQAQAGIFDRVAVEATQLLQRISGRDGWGTITLSDGLSPGAFVPGASGESIELESLSGGEYEQVHLATRLALAKILTASERHLVVLDDVLMATDDKRLGRILEMIEENRARMQFLILTCHRERYASLSSADFISMDQVTGSRPASAKG